MREVVGEELGLERGREVVAGLENAREETAWIYEELVNIAAVARDENLVQEMFKARRSPGEGREEKEEGRKEKQGRQQGQEEKNKFALSVLRRLVMNDYFNNFAALVFCVLQDCNLLKLKPDAI